MKRGTHNSATGGRLIWWLRPLAWVINPTSKCQDRSIVEQLEDGVKFFNLQVSLIGGKWRFTHGMGVYEEDVLKTLKLIRLCATPEKPIFFQLYLDNCFWCKKSIRRFIDLVDIVKDRYCNVSFVMHEAWVQNTDIYLHRSANNISIEEHYWSLGWAKTTKKWYNFIPLPKRHAKKYNKVYKGNNQAEFLMLDYYELG